MNDNDRSRSVTRARHLLRMTRRRLRGRGTGTLRTAYRVLLLVIAALAIDIMFPERPAPDLPVLEEGMVAAEDVIADFQFPVYKSEAELGREREEAAAAVPPVFDHRPAVADSARQRADAFFEAIEEALANAEDDAERRRAALNVLARQRITVTDTQLELLLSQRSRQRLRANVLRVIGSRLRGGVVASGELGTASTGGVILRSGGAEGLVRRDSLTTMQQFYQQAASDAPSSLGAAGLQLYQQLLIHFSEPTVRLDRAATEGAREQARQAVAAVKYEVLEGERIVTAHDRVSPEQVERLRAYQQALSDMGLSAEGRTPLGTRAGSLLFNVLLLVILGLLLRYFRPEIYASDRSITLIWLLLLSVIGATGVIAATGAPSELIPVAFAALVVATLFDGLLAALLVFVLVALAVARPPLLGMTALFFTVVGGSAAALSGRVVRRRAQAWSFAAVIAGAYLLAAVSLALMLQLDIAWVFKAGAWGTVNAVGSTLLAVGVIPVAESFTGITTDQTLLELADLNRPILRRLSLEAPGTYAHSINVANIAEAAAREIGANSLLVRVGVYYHDVGKLKKPQYFVENQPRGRNPHDKLKPSMSANIVREHVEEGLELADEAGLPDVVKRFVTEHHGDQRIGFFWEKANELDPDGEYDIEEFTYPGPKPQSKETAIALLADSVESAARALQDPTPESISALVDRIVGAKISEGQLDHAPLTLREVSKIKEQFVKVLTGMYHHRIDYPAPEAEVAPSTTPAAGTPSSPPH